jgi:hypothetical protein
VVEEKLDGTNVGIHFTTRGRMVLQCRGHEITEGMHPQYDLFKQWTSAKRPVLEPMLGWLARHRPSLPVVSLDAIRAELDVAATGSDVNFEQDQLLHRGLWQASCACCFTQCGKMKRRFSFDW